MRTYFNMELTKVVGEEVVLKLPVTQRDYVRPTNDLNPVVTVCTNCC
jgi:hypothetical protein